jgi:PAS domain S-box-containing protein
VVSVEVTSDREYSILGRAIQDPRFGRDWVEPYRQGRISAIADIYSQGVTPCYVEFLEQYQVKANLVVPILQNLEVDRQTQANATNLWGLLIAHQCRQKRTWQTEEIELLKQIADQVAIAIHQAELLTNIQTELNARKKAETDLALSETRFRRLAENAQDVIFRHRLLPQAETEYINPAIAEITGYSPAEFYRDPQLFSNLIALQDRNKWGNYLQNPNQKTSLTILRWLDANGKIIWMEMQITPVLDNNNNLIALEGIARELSKQSFLSFPRRKMSTLLSPISQLFLKWQSPVLMGGLITVTGAIAIEFLDRAGINLPSPFLWLLFPVLLSSSFGGIAAGLASAIVWSLYLLYATIFQSVYERLTAGIFPMSLGIVFVFFLALLLGKQKEENEQLTQALQIANERLEKQVERRTKALVKNNELLKQEIDERKQAESQIKETGNFLQVTIEHLPVAIFVKDGKPDRFGKFRLWNKKSEQMFGLTSEQVIGRTDYDFFPKQQADWFWQTDQQVFAEGVPFDIAEETIDSRNLGTRILHIIKVPLYDRHNQPEYLLGICEDITERKQAERELLEKSQALTEFSTNLKHLHRLNTTNHDSFEDLLADYLDTGCEIFACSTGIVTRIADGLCTIYAVKSDLDLSPNQQFALNNTYCAAVAKEKSTIAYNHVGGMVEMQNHPLYQYLKLETYLGTPIFVDGEVYGSLSFLSHQIREDNFSDREREVIELMAQSIGKFISADRIDKERQQAEQALRTAKVELELRVAERTAELSQTNLQLQQKLQEIQQSEEERANLIAILEATPDFISSATVEGKVTYFNRAARELLGFSLDEEIIDWRIPNSHPEGAYQILRDRGIPTAIRDGVWIGETIFLSHDGREIPFSQLIIAHKKEDGRVKMLSTIARDISSAKQIEATLRESERRWRSLMENVRAIVVGLDRDGKVEYINPFFLELTGYTQAEVIGKNWFANFLPKSQNSRVEQNFLDVIAGNLHPHYQNSIVTKSGEEKMILWNNTLLQSPQGEAIGTISIGEDVTERYTIERMKDEFISVVSHELRTPLTSIHGALNLLSSNLVTPDSAQGKRVMEIAAASTDRLVRLVNDILELERLESGKLRLSKQLIDVSELMFRAIDQVQIVANRAGIQLEVHPYNLEIFVDGDRIIQVLTNLLSNAIKFSEANSTVWLTVQVSIENNLRRVLFSVKDEGRGIPSDKLESVFERFHQVDASDSRRKDGTGLGLAICRNIIEQHEGKIWVESSLGHGSIFYFSLPMNNEQQTSISD